MLKFKRMRQHSKGCEAVSNVKSGIWKNAWAYGELVYLAYGKDKRWTKMVLRVPCNDPNCQGYLIISMEDFLQELPAT